MIETKYLIIGGGVAGTSAAETIRHHDPDGTITLVTDEKERLYSRVLLPHYLRDTTPLDRVFLKKETFYSDNRISFRPQTRIKNLDTTTKIATAENGDQFQYEKLLIATGGKLVPWESDNHKKGIVYLRTIEDAKNLKALLTSGQEAVVVGGGFIAIEFAVSFVKNGIHTTMLVREPYLFQKFLDAEGGQLVTSILQKNGITVKNNETIREVKGEERVTGVLTEKGETISCQLVGVGIGILPNLRFLDSTPIIHDPFIQTDEHFRVEGASDVWAAGDITFFPSRLVGGRRINFQNWANAVEQGRLAGAGMAGDSSQEIPLSTTYSINFFDSSISAVGITNPNLADQVLHRGSLAEGKLGRIFKKEGRLIGALLIGLPADRVHLMKLMGQNIGPSFDDKIKYLDFSFEEMV